MAGQNWLVPFQQIFFAIVVPVSGSNTQVTNNLNSYNNNGFGSVRQIRSTAGSVGSTVAVVGVGVI